MPRNNRSYSLDDKLNAVKEYLSGEGTQIEICKKYKIRSTSCLREWIKVYNDGGNLDTVKHSGGGSYMKQGRSTTKEERIKIAEAKGRKIKYLEPSWSRHKLKSSS